MKKWHKDMFAVFLIGAVALLCEIFLFNFKHWDSTDEPLSLKEMQVSLEGISRTENGFCFEADEAFIEINGLNRPISYLYMYPREGEGRIVSIQVSARDEANSQWLAAPVRNILTEVPYSQYIHLHFGRQVKDIKVRVEGLNGAAIKENDFVLNVKVPLMISWKRAGILFLFICLLYFLRPGCAVWKYRTDLKKRSQKFFVIGIVILQAVLFWNMIRWNTTVTGWHQNFDHHRQYYELLDAFEQGRLDVGEAPKELAELENPYDKRGRDAAGLSHNVKWDHAYYQGNYYVYFGVVPAVLLYAPYRFLFGSDLPNYQAVYFLGIVVMTGSLFLIWQIIRRWFSQTPFALYLLLSVVFPTVSCLGYAVLKPDFYIVPLMSAIALGMYGLGFWISAEEKMPDHTKRLVPRRMAAGSLCIALIAGCRPQMLLIMVFALVLFQRACFKERLLFSKKGLAATAAFCIPFAAIACLIMWYNFARFGSPFDFGATYNLTTNDMTNRGFVWGRTALGLFSFFLQPPSINAVFPFLHDFGVQTTYQGLTLTEQMVGGIYWLFPILLPGVWGIFQKKKFADTMSYGMVFCAGILSLGIACIDLQMAGLLTRYFLDFVCIAMVGAVISVCAEYGASVRQQNRQRQTSVIKTAVLLSCISLLMVFLRIFAHSEDSIREANPVLYYTVQHLVAFWM